MALFAIASITVMAHALLQRYCLYEWVNSVTGSSSGRGKLPLVMKRNSILAGQVRSPSDGTLFSLGWDRGTYYGRANGTVMLEVCAVECRRGSLHVSCAEDNRFAYIFLGRPLPLTAGAYVQFKLTMSENSTHPVAFWGYRADGVTADVMLDGHPSGIGPAATLGTFPRAPSV